jgi:glycogen(starch) synthase
MKILILSNKFPPYNDGGYELACSDVAEGLQRKGHEVYVLTSTYGVGKPVVEENVFRYLHCFDHVHLHEIMYKLWLYQKRDQHILQKLLHKLQPDLLYVWNVGRLPRSLVMTYKNAPIPIIYAISSYWMFHDTVYKDWHELWARHAGTPFRQALKTVLRRCVPDVQEVVQTDIPCQYAHFFSRMLQEEYRKQGVEPTYSQIIYHGIHIEDFMPRRSTRISENRNDNHIRLLYSGQFGKHKGVHTALEALSYLIHHQGHRHITLSLVGSSPFPEYKAEIEQYIANHQLELYVKLIGKVPREALVDIYHSHDILIFPSIWPEPFSITILEAMASYLPIIGTTTGGSAEIFVHGENCLTFSPENSIQLAERITQLMRDADLRRRISTNAFNTVREQFDTRHIVDEIEHFLQYVLNVHNT